MDGSDLLVVIRGGQEGVSRIERFLEQNCAFSSSSSFFFWTLRFKWRINRTSAPTSTTTIVNAPTKNPKRSVKTTTIACPYASQQIRLTPLLLVLYYQAKPSPDSDDLYLICISTIQIQNKASTATRPAQTYINLFDDNEDDDTHPISAPFP